MSEKPANKQVTRKVMEEFVALQRSKRVNMNDRLAVYTIARHQGLDTLARFVLEDLKHPDRQSVYIFEIMQRKMFYLDLFKLRKE